MSPRSKSRATPTGKAKRAPFEERMAPFIVGLPDDSDALIDLYEAYRAAYDALVGIYNRPRVVAGPAEGLIQEEIEVANDRACAVAEKLKQVPFINDLCSDIYVQIMMRHAVFCGANIDEMLSYLAAARAVPVKRHMKLAASANRHKAAVAATLVLAS